MAQKRSRNLYESDVPEAHQQQQSPYVFYGTALPPLDSSVRDDGSYVPVWKQEVLDERGRKRLHGAFTGGFSAGYFNTVGSKEGWTPSTFVSSRSNRRNKDASVGNNATDTQPQREQHGTRRPEDYMDEEDLADQAESQRLQTASTFSGLGSTESELASRGAGAALMDVLKTSGGNTMGVRLLRRMGWRDGQGVGARVWRKARDDGDFGEGEAGEEKMHLFAPRNTEMVRFVKKHDSKGVGYEGEAGLENSMGTRRQEDEDEDGDDDNNAGFGTSDLATRNPMKVKKKEVRKGAFGVGILNDTGSDDEDPYEIGPKISYNRVIGKDKSSKKAKAKNGRMLSGGAANPLLGSNKPVFIPKSSKASTAGSKRNGFRKCSDGRLPLEGFLLATEAPDTSSSSSVVNQDGRYPPPEIPQDWKSSKQPPSSTEQSATADFQSVADAAKLSKMDPKARAALLGEAQLPGKSVFDFLSPAARDRLASASGKGNLPAGLGEAAPKGFSLTEEEQQKELSSLVPQLDQQVAIKALGRGVGGWMPYAEDETKRARYRAYLEGRAGLRSGLPERAPGATKDEWAKELGEFAHAAQIFKPMTGMMASRFTSSSSQPSVASDAPDPTGAKSGFEKPEDPAEAAAKAGMYGPMTRSIGQFFPTRLLCKRFNVKPPAHVQVDPDAGGGGESGGGGTPGGTAAASAGGRFQSGGYQTNSSAVPSKTLSLVNASAMNEMMRESVTSQGDAQSELDSGEKTKGKDALSTPRDGPSSNKSAAPPTKLPVDAEHNEALEAERPGEAVFKAIFGSDDEDEDDD
ncbi:MAG: serine/threonine-protein kinase KIN2 [Chaenotheca gracillima]|nr:MAG: serine/threonine-protein kinase KIN2 [Chaenotheca gracillima]